MARRNLQISINEEDLQMIETRIKEAIGEVGAKNIEDKNIQLQQAAVDFIRPALEIIKQLKEYQLQEETSAQGIKYITQNRPVSPTTYKAYFNREKIANLENTQLIQTFLEQSLIFNSKVISILTGKPLETVVVFRQGDEVIAYKFDGEQLLKDNIYKDFTASKRGANLIGRLQFSASGLSKTLQESAQGLQKIEKAGEGQQINNLNRAYIDALDDYDYFASKGQKPYVFFHPENSDRWMKMRVAGGHGDIAEAYGLFLLVLIPDNTKLFASALRWANLTIYFKMGVSQVDNASGLYTADVVGNSVNYAIKSLKASLPGYLQMLELAQEIVIAAKQGANDILASENVKSLITREEMRTQKAQNAVRNTLEIVVENAITPIIEGVNQVISS